MSTQIIQARLASYACKTALEEEQALREITQEIPSLDLWSKEFFMVQCRKLFGG